MNVCYITKRVRVEMVPNMFHKPKNLKIYDNVAAFPMKHLAVSYILKRMPLQNFKFLRKWYGKPKTESYSSLLLLIFYSSVLSVFLSILKPEGILLAIFICLLSLLLCKKTLWFENLPRLLLLGRLWFENKCYSFFLAVLMFN